MIAREEEEKGEDESECNCHIGTKLAENGQVSDTSELYTAQWYVSKI